ncbi:MAG: RsmD family RNA methyltransferase [Pirellulaceae bacterium]
MKKTHPTRAEPQARPPKAKATMLRVIGGDMRGRKVRYNGDRSTRPMRDSVRENLFNLIGMQIKDAVVFDPFGGTGILAIESISRGARHAFVIEQNRRTLNQIRQNIDDLQLQDRIKLTPGDAFRGLGRLMHESHQQDPDAWWVLYLCPPYEMFQSRLDDINRMIQFVRSIHDRGTIVAESDNKFETEQLTGDHWDVRKYGLTQLAITDLDCVQPD